VKLNTNISIENIVTILTMVCAVTLAFSFMKYDINALQKELKTKADKELITYKIDVMMEDITEIKEILKEKRK
jgi:hypothetical protein|tara:strand:- start:243 stop:461 length:219 start_codon:yes stop_codon:yes gene_type:complete